MAPIGMTLAKPEQVEQKQIEKKTHAKRMLEQALGTEVLIEKCLELVDPGECSGDDEEDQSWPADTVPNARLVKGLSHSKMINEINHKAPRGFDKIGNIAPQPVLTSRTGCHCSFKTWRRSDLDQLGLGVNLYFKMLKYLGFMFLLFFAVSLPTLAIFKSGNIYDTHHIALQRQIGALGLGNLENTSRVVPFSAVVQPSSNLGGYIVMECPAGQTIDELMHFGLAYRNYTVTGMGLDVTVKTIDRCTLGKMSDMTNEYLLEKQF